MSEPPRHLLEHLASLEEQRRYVLGATVDEYLLPEEMLNDARRFCRRVERAHIRDTLTIEQRDVVERLKEALARLGGCIDLYDKTSIADLIERDTCWAVIRSRAREALDVFRPTASI
jgi:hypothetical protein